MKIQSDCDQKDKKANMNTQTHKLSSKCHRKNHENYNGIDK